LLHGVNLFPGTKFCPCLEFEDFFNSSCFFVLPGTSCPVAPGMFPFKGWDFRIPGPAPPPRYPDHFLLIPSIQSRVPCSKNAPLDRFSFFIHIVAYLHLSILLLLFLLRACGEIFSFGIRRVRREPRPFLRSRAFNHGRASEPPSFFFFLTLFFKSLQNFPFPRAPRKPPPVTHRLFVLSVLESTTLQFLSFFFLSFFHHLP